MPDFADEAVTPQVRKAAAWAWRLVVLAAAAAVLFWLIQRFVVIVVPLALALILTALFLPAVDWLHRRRVPRSLAVFPFRSPFFPFFPLPSPLPKASSCIASLSHARAVSW